MLVYDVLSDQGNSVYSHTRQHASFLNTSHWAYGCMKCLVDCWFWKVAKILKGVWEWVWDFARWLDKNFAAYWSRWRLPVLTKEAGFQCSLRRTTVWEIHLRAASLMVGSFHINCLGFFLHVFLFQAIDAVVPFPFFTRKHWLHLIFKTQLTERIKSKSTLCTTNFSILPAVICYKAPAWWHHMWRKMAVECKMHARHHLFTVSHHY